MRTRLHLAAALLACSTAAAGGGCGTTSPKGAASLDELQRTINALRAQNAGYTRQIEELQNRIFILQDQLDSRKVAAERVAAPHLPVVTLHPSEVSETSGSGAPEFPGDPDVEYAGDAVTTSTARPVLRLSGVERPSAPPPLPPSPRFASSPPAPRPRPLAVAGERSIPDGDDGPLAPSSRALLPAAAAAAAPSASAPTYAAAPSNSAGSAPAAPDGGPIRLYQQSLELLKGGQHAEAVAGFRRFVARHARHDYADNAQYWLGECFYDMKDHRTAVREFRRVVDRFPLGNKVPDALLKAGYSYLALGETEAGREVLRELVKSYPTHEAARLAELRLAESSTAAAAAAETAKPMEVR